MLENYFQICKSLLVLSQLAGGDGWTGWYYFVLKLILRIR